MDGFRLWSFVLGIIGVVLSLISLMISINRIDSIDLILILVIAISLAGVILSRRKDSKGISWMVIIPGILLALDGALISRTSLWFYGGIILVIAGVLYMASLVGKRVVKPVLIVLAVIAVILIIWHFPKSFDTCYNGRVRCNGWVFTHEGDVYFLDIAESRLEKKTEKVKVCISLGNVKDPDNFYLTDWCPGENEFPIPCDRNTKCGFTQTSMFSNIGLECEDWRRACDALEHQDSVGIRINNTQVAAEMLKDYQSFLLELAENHGKI